MHHSEVLSALHNPANAGAYAYGRRKHTIDFDGQHQGSWYEDSLLPRG